MHQAIDKENNAASAAIEVINMNDHELRKLLRAADHREERDDFYREQYIEEQLEDDCLNDEEAAFVMGYLAA